MGIIETRLLKRVNRNLVAAVLALLLVGLLALYSASRGVTSDPLYFVKRQLLAVVLGCGAALLAFRIDYRVLRQYTGVIYWASVASLLAVLVVGKRGGGAQSWIGFGSLQFQPAEYAKVAFAMEMAHQMSGVEAEDLCSMSGLRRILLYAAVPFGLVVVQPDLGSALVFGGVLAAMLYIAGAPAKLFARMGALVGMVTPVAYEFGMRPYQRKRLTIFINPWIDRLGDGYNVIQSTIAVGAGRFFGKGYLQGSQARLKFLPAHHTDFIFSVFAEEFGFLGGLLLLGLFLWLFTDTVRRLGDSYDRYGMLLVTGLLAIWIFHVLENVGMAMGIMPITGIPLPFVSYGGSALLMNLVAVGLVANVQARSSRVLL